MNAFKNAYPGRLFNLRREKPILWLTLTAMFMAVNIALSSFGVPVPGGHLYLNDIVICMAALILDPIGAAIAGGVGAFLGDFFFYPAPMFVSLVTHGLQAALISLCVRRIPQPESLKSIVIGLAIGVIVMVTGYSLGRAFIYSTPEYALLKLPYQFAQALIGAILAPILYYKCGLRRQLIRIVG